MCVAPNNFPYILAHEAQVMHILSIPQQFKHFMPIHTEIFAQFNRQAEDRAVFLAVYEHEV